VDPVGPDASSLAVLAGRAYPFDVHRKVVFRLSPDDVSSIRFGISPGMELAGAVRALQDPGQHPLHWGWMRQARDRVPPDALTLLSALIGSSGYFPDFLVSEASWDLTQQEELRRLRQADLGIVSRDLEIVSGRTTGSRRALLERLVADPAGAREVVADAWERAWDTLISPQWPALDRLVRADVGTRARRLAQHGLGAMVSTLHERVSWHGDSVGVQTRSHSQVVDCTGSGLVLVPSVFMRTCAVVVEAPAQPTLHYPAHGVSETWSRDGPSGRAALGALLGQGRAQVLLVLSEPLSTSETALACDLAPSTASHHLHVLRSAGLVTSQRDGRLVLHARTAMGDALLGAAHPHTLGP
jgi:DNA-binding transcriptional ArsR family regulator